MQFYENNETQKKYKLLLIQNEKKNLSNQFFVTSLPTTITSVG